MNFIPLPACYFYARTDFYRWIYCCRAKMKGDLEYAGHAHPSKETERRSPIVSGLGVIGIVGFLITITTAGTIFGVHLINRIDNLQVCFTM